MTDIEASHPSFIAALRERLERNEEVAAAKRGPTVEEVEKLAASTERMGPLVWVSFGGGEAMAAPQ